MRTTPTELPQPNVAQYGEEWLTLLDEWSWDTPGSSWKAGHGGALPYSDPAKPKKLWVDLSLDPNDADNQLVQYHILSMVNSVWVFKPTVMTVQEAMTENIPNPPDLYGHLWDAAGVRGTPVRLLKPNETFISVAGGMGIAIQRNDVAGNGPFALADRVLLQAIAKALNVQVP